MPGRHWLLRTLSVDHQIARFDLTAVPKKKMKHYEDSPLQIETIIRRHDHEKGAGIEVLAPLCDHDEGAVFKTMDGAGE
jgi:hypothetical protein